MSSFIALRGGGVTCARQRQEPETCQGERGWQEWGRQREGAHLAIIHTDRAGLEEIEALYHDLGRLAHFFHAEQVAIIAVPVKPHLEPTERRGADE